MTVVPWIDWTAAEQVGLEFVPVGPSVSRRDREQIVSQLRQQARRARGIITEASGLPEVGEARELVVDRRNLVRANVATAREVMAELGSAPNGPLSAAAGQLRGASIGTVLALIGSRILGQYDPFGSQPTLYLVAPTILAVERHLRVDPTDFRMWVTLHEQTHRVQFANAPWLRGHLLAQMAAMLDDTDADWHDESWRHQLGRHLEQLRRDKAQGRPVSLRVVNAVSSPATVAALDKVSAVMSLLEGHADVMMDRAGRAVIPSVAVIRSRFDARRSRGGVHALLDKLLGMDAKLAQYADGAKFCRHVVREGGVELLNRAFSGPEALPSLTELLHPEQWCERMAQAAAPVPTQVADAQAADTQAADTQAADIQADDG